MKILIISDYYEKELAPLFHSKLVQSYNRSGLLYEENIFNSFLELYGPANVKMVCVPTCGTFPNVSKQLFFKKYKSQNNSVIYVNYINLIYYRNVSRYIHLKNYIKHYLKEVEKDEPLYILSIQMHLPFMKIVRFIKKHHKNTYSCLNVWDFPDMMNNRNMGFFKKILKKINTDKVNSYVNDFDLFYYLCDGMKDRINSTNYFVSEGLISNKQINIIKEFKRNRKYKSDEFHIVYTGKLTTIDGVKDLVDAFVQIKDPYLILDIAGGGELADYIKDASKRDQRIIFYGLLEKEEVCKLQSKANLFVFPRLPEDYTNFSFPSKVIEYVIAGAPILSHDLKCFPIDLKNELILIQELNNANLKNDIERAIFKIRDDKFSPNYEKFINNNLSTSVAKRIIEMLNLTGGRK